ncbi:MAG: cytochrome c maturation protein CcmE [Gemmatimonadaceae bacterium]|jgi:cytochrome c-type biogenesis protein CcmE|nr:cytochrome c maturation protein CcmE [Gemmatimonadaceae bacterium]
MKARTKFLLGGFVILSTASYLAAKTTSETATYYLTPTELASRVKADDDFRENGVKVGASVVPGSIRRNPSGKEVAFRMRDSLGTIYPVVYRGIIPDTFTDSVDVVVEGRLDDQGTFQATVLLAKCASRYENAPGKPGQPGQYAPGARHPAGIPKSGTGHPDGVPMSPAPSAPDAPARGS